MSMKYRRIKQGDMALPAPLRWLTRAFSSITLAVVLLVLVALYGIAGSVPVMYLLVGLEFVLAGLVTLGPAVLFAWWAKRRLKRWRLPAVAALLLAATAGVALGWTAFEWTIWQPFFMRHHATVIYRLPAFEMTEPEFYAWWPMQVLLGLFVVNMVWATIRRIEFKFVNIGVLTVHSGIVVLALGAMLYGRFKVEGDTLLFRPEVGGRFVSHFYDAFMPAIYVSHGDDPRQVLFPLPELPRYNDYDLGELDIALHDRPGFAYALGDDLEMRILGFLAYARMEHEWVAADEADVTQPRHLVVKLAQGEFEQPGEGPRLSLAADIPGARVLETPAFELEVLPPLSPQRRQDLMSSFEGPHGLVVEVPGQDFREVYPIAANDVIEVGDTGYRVRIEEIGPYGMPFATPGYEGASDTHARVHIDGPDKHFTRFVLHRYPERNQDFVPAEDDPNAGPMGRRTDPDPAIRLTYLDASKPQYHVMPHEDGRVELLVRVPETEPMLAWLPDGRIPLPQATGEQSWLHVVEILPEAVQVARPTPVDKLERSPKDEGTFLHALMPVSFELDQHPETGKPWRKIVWLRHMRYPDLPEGDFQPKTVDVPGVGPVTVAFSRQRYDLPFAMRLVAFKMTPYEGSQIPQDFRSDVQILDLNEQRMPIGQLREAHARMNHPITHTAAIAPLPLKSLRLSQSGWDAPNPDDPMAFAQDEQGRFLRQQRFTILGVGNNVGISIIWTGGLLVGLGIPWAFYVKPWLVRRQKSKIQKQLAEGTYPLPPRRSVPSQEPVSTPS